LKKEYCKKIFNISSCKIQNIMVREYIRVCVCVREREKERMYIRKFMYIQ